MTLEKPPLPRKQSLNKIVGVSEGFEQELLNILKLQKEERNRIKREAITDLQEDGENIKMEWFTDLNKKLSAFLVEYGLEEASAINFLDVVWQREDEFLGENDSTMAFYDATDGGKIYIKFKEEMTEQDFARLFGFLSHELIHAHSFQSAQMDKDNEKSLLKVRRVGLAITKRPDVKTPGEEQKLLTAGKWLNEAVTEELNALFLNSLAESNLPEDEFSSAMAKEYLDSTCRKIYPHERGFLIRIIQLLYAHFPNKHTSIEDIFKLYTRAALNGDIRPLAK